MHPTSQNQRHEFEQVDISPRTKIQHNNNRNTPENRTVKVEYSIMRNIMESATETELRGLFENYQKERSIQTALAEMGHSQTPTPVATDNTAANRIVNVTEKKDTQK